MPPQLANTVCKQMIMPPLAGGTPRLFRSGRRCDIEGRNGSRHGRSTVEVKEVLAVQPMGSIQHQSVNDVDLLVLDGSFEMPAAVSLDRTLRDLVQRGSKKLLLDLARVTYMVSTGFRSIINVQVRLSLVDGRLRVVCPPNTPIRRILATTRLDRILNLFDTREAALESLDRA